MDFIGLIKPVRTRSVHATIASQWYRLVGERIPLLSSQSSKRTRKLVQDERTRFKETVFSSITRSTIRYGLIVSVARMRAAASPS